MKLVIFGEEEIECNKKSDVIKLSMLAFAIPAGLILSCALAYLNIDFIKLFNTFCENVLNPEVLDKLVQIMKKWFIISGIALFLALLLPVLYFVCNEKEYEKSFTWRQTLFLTSELILISQTILPLFTIIAALLIAFIYLLFYSSLFLKDFLKYGTYLYILIVEKICTSSGIALTYSEFIGQERYSMFLTIITFLVSVPYLLSFSLRIIKKVIQIVAGRELIEQIFKPIEAIISVNVLRYAIYMLLFFTSVFTYSVTILQSDYIFSIFKEALLEFVLLDTVIYSIISKLKDMKINYKQQKSRKYYVPLKYDLEFALSAITIHNLKNKKVYARINFSEDINSIPRKKKPKSVNEIDKLIMDISTNYYTIEILERKLKVVLHRIIDLIG